MSLEGKTSTGGPAAAGAVGVEAPAAECLLEGGTVKEKITRDTSAKKTPIVLNTGKWTPEEFEYMLGLMEAFKAGHLPLQEGTTLRGFLSSMMKCKPKRISKKFEGISYNGRLTYKTAKDALSLQAAMLLRARLSELERRYLAAAEERDEGGQMQDHTSIDELLQQAMPTGTAGLPASGSMSLALPSSLAHQGTGSTAASHGDLFNNVPQDNPLSSMSGLGELGSLGGQLAGQLGDQELAFLKDMERARQRQSLISNSAGNSGLSANRFQQHEQKTTTTSLLSAGLASGNEAFCNMNNFMSSRENRQNIAANYQNQVNLSRELEQQQLLSSLSNGTNTSLALAALQQHRDRNRASFSNGSSLDEASRAAFPNLPLQSSRELLGSINNNDATLPSSSQHSIDFNRFVLQAPQDDATYFRQRLLPGMSSSNNTTLLGIGGGGNGNGMNNQSFDLASRLGSSSGSSLMDTTGFTLAQLEAATAGAGIGNSAGTDARASFSQLLKRQMEQNDALEQWKRQRR